MTIKCYGCGISLQTNHQDEDGYVKVIDRDMMLCTRCFQMTHYNKYHQSKINEDTFLDLMHQISEQDALIVYLIDVFDLQGSFVTGFAKMMKDKDVLVVANKIDLLPKSVKDEKILRYLKQSLKEAGVSFLDIMLMSAIKKEDVISLMHLIEYYRHDRDVFIVGTTNVGKSTLINSMLKMMGEGESHLLTTSYYPGTTLKMVGIPLTDETSLYDSPGILNHFQMLHYVDPLDYKQVIPKTRLKPIIYQLNDKQTLFVEQLVRFDFVEGESGSVTCYFSSQLHIHRTKLEKANEFRAFDEVGLKIKATIQEHVEYRFKDITHCDLLIPGLGWFALVGDFKKVNITVPKGVVVIERKAFI